MKNNNLIIKVGGGYETLTKYLKSNSKLQCLTIHQLMEKESINYQEAVTRFLEKAKASKQVINDFIKEQNQELPFNEFMKALKQREKNKWENNKKSLASADQISNDLKVDN